MKLLVAKSNEATTDQSTPHTFYTYNTNKLSIGASYGDYQLSKFSIKLQARQKTPPSRYSSTLDTPFGKEWHVESPQDIIIVLS